MRIVQIVTIDVLHIDNNPFFKSLLGTIVAVDVLHKLFDNNSFFKSSIGNDAFLIWGVMTTFLNCWGKHLQSRTD